MAASPQLNITQFFTLSQAQILTLNSVPFIAAPAISDFINVFQSATISYSYSVSPFTNVDNLLSFQILPSGLSPVLVSNSLGATNIIGINQSTTITFIPANPYEALMSACANAPIVFTLANADPLGGNSASLITMSFTYALFQSS